MKGRKERWVKVGRGEQGGAVGGEDAAAGTKVRDEAEGEVALGQLWAGGEEEREREGAVWKLRGVEAILRLMGGEVMRRLVQRMGRIGEGDWE